MSPLIISCTKYQKKLFKPQGLQSNKYRTHHLSRSCCAIRCQTR